MVIDPWMASTVGVGLVAAWNWARAKNLERKIQFHKNWADHMVQERDRMWCDLSWYQDKERRRLEQLRAAGRKGKAVQARMNAAKRKTDEKVMAEARQRTIEALGRVTLADRDEVVANVRAERKRKKEQRPGAGMAAKKG